MPPALITIDFNERLEKNRAEQRRLLDQVDQVTAAVVTEKEERGFTPDESAKIKELQDRIVQLRETAKHLESSIELHRELDGSPQSRSRQDIKPGRKAGFVDDAEEQAQRAKEYRSAYSSYLLRGERGLSQAQREILESRMMNLDGNETETRALSAQVGALGAYTIPTELNTSLEMAMKSYSGVLQAGVTVLNTSGGNDIQMPTSNDTNNIGEILGEGQDSTSADPAFGLITLRAFVASSKNVPVPVPLLQDSAVPIEQRLNDMLAERLGRIINRHLTIGTGANQAQGVVTAATLGKTTASATAIAFGETIDLQHSVDPAYRNGAAFMAHDSIIGALRKLIDSDGRPIWQPAMNAGMANGAPGTLNGDPYFINQDMDSAITAGKKTLLYGQFSKYYVRRVGGVGVFRLDQTAMKKYQIEFIAFTRFDGKLIDAGANAIKYLQQV
jgi:HK97 family phage major capsid protein